MRLALFLLIPMVAFAQVPNRAYMKIDAHKRVYKRAFTKQDTLDWQVRETDTLILVSIEDLNRFPSVDFEYRDQTFLDLYMEIAFRGPKSNDGNIYHTYWKQPVKMYLSPSVPKNVRRDFVRFVREVTAGIDSLRIGMVDNPGLANFFVYCTGDFDYEPRLKDTYLRYYNNWNGRNQITKSSIKLDRSQLFNERLFLDYLKRLFVQSLGNFTWSDKIGCESFFSACEKGAKSFGEFDREILRYHYSYGICKGIGEEQFTDLHRSALEFRKMHPNIRHQVKHMN